MLASVIAALSPSTTRDWLTYLPFLANFFFVNSYTFPLFHEIIACSSVCIDNSVYFEFYSFIFLWRICKPGRWYFGAPLKTTCMFFTHLLWPHLHLSVCKLFWVNEELLRYGTHSLVILPLEPLLSHFDNFSCLFPLQVARLGWVPLILLV